MIKYLRINAVEIAKFIYQIEQYTGITVVGNINEGSSYTQTYPIATITSVANNFFITDCDLYIKPQFFGLTEFVDGIYNLTISLNKSTGFILIKNCVFVDVTFKCKVAGLLQALVEENKLLSREKKPSLIHLLHYSLINGNNCGCNCTDLYTVFKELDGLLSNIDPTILRDCGC